MSSQVPVPRLETSHPLRSVAGAAGVSVTAVLPAYLTGALAVQMMPELGFGPVALGAAVSGFSIGSTVSSVLLGHVTEKIGWSRALKAGGTGSAVVLLAIATVTRSWEILAMVLIMGGIVNALAHPAASLGLARSIQDGRQGVAFGIKASALPGATLLAGLAVPFVALTVGWRWAFILAALLALSASLLVPPRQIGLSVPVPARANRPAASGPIPTLVSLAVAAALGLAAIQALAVFAVAAAVEVGFSEASAGRLLAIGSATAVAGRILLGWAADRYGLTGLPQAALLVGIGSVGFGFLASGRPFLFVAGVMLAFGSGWAWTGLFNLAVVRYAPDAPGFATGITQTGIYVGSAAGPFTFGYLVNRYSFEVAWSAATASILVASLVLFLVSWVMKGSTSPKFPPP